jgi:hypothetical protein
MGFGNCVKDFSFGIVEGYNNAQGTSVGFNSVRIVKPAGWGEGEDAFESGVVSDFFV